MVGIFWLGVEFVVPVSRVDAQSQEEEEEDVSTGEISEEVSETDSISDEPSPDEDTAEASSPPNAGNHGIGRPLSPLRPSR